MSASCLFCRIVAGEIPADTVTETATTYAFRDVNPQAPVHVLVIPKIHVAHVHAIGDDHRGLLDDLFATARSVALSEGLAGADGDGEPGYRIVANVGTNGGMSVAHLHLHVLGSRALRWPPG